MSDPPWLDPLREDLATHPRAPIAQLATVDADGAPEVRSVVLRGLDDGGAPLFGSDARSAKFAGGGDMALCLWLAPAGVQWRLRGAARLVGEGAAEPWARARRAAWEASDAVVRRGLAGPPPGRPLDAAPAGPADPPEAPPAAFVLVRVLPSRAERLVLGAEHRRTRWRRGPRGWAGLAVVP